MNGDGGVNLKTGFSEPVALEVDLADRRSVFAVLAELIGVVRLPYLEVSLLVWG